jgi:hypothetical protein
MKAAQHTSGAFQKVGECLYRYSSNGVYYARVRTDGKEVRRSLGGPRSRAPQTARTVQRCFPLLFLERRWVERLFCSEINFC